SSVRAILATGSEKLPPGTRIKLVFRWLVVAAVAYLANRTGYFPAIGIVTGCSRSPAARLSRAFTWWFELLFQVRYAIHGRSPPDAGTTKHAACALITIARGSLRGCSAWRRSGRHCRALAC